MTKTIRQVHGYDWDIVEYFKQKINNEETDEKRLQLLTDFGFFANDGIHGSLEDVIVDIYLAYGGEYCNNLNQYVIISLFSEFSVLNNIISLIENKTFITDVDQNLIDLYLRYLNFDWVYICTQIHERTQ